MSAYPSLETDMNYQHGAPLYPPVGQAPPYSPGGNVPPYAQPGNMPPYPQPGNMPPYSQPTYNPQASQPYPMPSGGQQYPPTNAPVVQQPGHNQWQSNTSNIPPGLECLVQADQLMVKQKVELLEAFISFETNNKYEVKNALGQHIFTAKESNDCLTRMCCGPRRPFEMAVKDLSKNEVIHISRPLGCDSCLFPCWLQSVEVSSPPGRVVGSVQQTWSIFTPQYDILNEHGDVVLKIEGPFCTWGFCGDVEFKVLSVDGNTQVGQISKKWSGMLREAFTDSDNFGISFPKDLDVKVKATLLGALFLVDYMFFEQQGRKQNDGIGMLS